MSKNKLDETLAVVIHSVLAADPKDGRIGQVDLTVEDAQGCERRLLIVVTERTAENAATTL